MRDNAKPCAHGKAKLRSLRRCTSRAYILQNSREGRVRIIETMEQARERNNEGEICKAGKT